MTEEQEIELIQLLELEKLERVSPKLEAFRNPARIKGCRGGRGAGAKSWSIVSLAIQRAHRQRTHIVFLREVQLTLEESVWKLVRDTIERLKYPGWVITEKYIDCPRVGSHIIFRGLSDLRADQIKSLEDFDIAIIEEAQSVSAHSLDILFPTIRKPGSEIWFGMNPDEEVDPIVSRTWGSGRDNMILIDLLPGPIDNPWWTKELQDEMDADFERDPDLAEHVWNGAPRVQGERSVLSREKIRKAMERDIDVDKNDVIEIGVDVARFGDDRSVIFKRQGMKVIDHKVFVKIDTQELARYTWDMAGRNHAVKIKVDDTGVGGGVTDKLKDMGAQVVPVNNGGVPGNKKLYTSCADEQWFEFPIEQACIPDNPDLMAELSARRFKYTRDDRKQIESKADFKKRYGKSPDLADALLLCYYTPNLIEWGFI